MFNIAAFGQITNVVASKRRVRGVLTVEVEDKTNRWVMDYEESKPHFIAWSSEIFNATGGKSYGNLRLMHQLQVIGKVSTELEFDDANKRILCEAEVTDDDAWAKVLNGELCGFSWSGNKVPPSPQVLTKWSGLADGARRYVGRPAELSLVDNPNQRGAYFEVVNAAGHPTFEIENEDGTKTVKECVFNVSLYEITSLAQQIQTLQGVWTGDTELEIELNKSIAGLLDILAKMSKNKKAELKETNASIQDMETAANAATGEDMANEVFNAAQAEEVFNAAIAKIDFTALLTPVVNAAISAQISPLQEQITAIAAATAAPTTVVTKETDSSNTEEKPAKTVFVANAAEGISEKDAASLNKIHNMHNIATGKK